MDFGLGLILSFTDNATSGINNAVNSLNQLTQTAESASASLNQMASLSALSVVSGQLGNAFTSAGQTIISTLGAVISKVNETGQTLMYAENQLGKLYEGSGKTGKDVLNDISAYAKSSIFDFEDLIPVVTMLKANGIEAFDMIASSTGNANQTLMDYAADLAAFNPQMRNAYGTGIQAAMGALNEYIAEGNAMSLKRGASLDITALLGEDKGATIEERSRQVADLMEQLNMVGMTAQLAQSPMVKLSNMGDTLFQFLGMIANSGVYDQFNVLVSKFADYVLSIPDEELENLAKTIGSALASLLKPLEKVIDRLLKFCDGVRTLLKENPKLAKFAIIITGIAGVLLVFLGTVLKVTSALSGVSLMFLAFGKSFDSIGGMFRSGMLKIMSILLPLTLAIGVMYGVWKSDLGGIRTMITSFVQNLVGSFQLAKTSVSGSLSEMQQVLKTFDTQNSFFDGLTLAIMRLMVLGRALVEGWKDYTLSEDTFLKAKELGILPLIEAIFDFLYRFRLFKEGFIEGWNEISNKVKTFVQGIVNSIDGTIFDDMLSGITSFVQSLSNNDPTAWKEFGVVIGELAAKAVLLAGAFKGLSTVGGIFTKLAGVVKPLLGLIMAHPVVAIIVGVIAALGILYAKSEDFRNLVGSIIEKLKQVGSEALATLMPLIQNVIGAVQEFIPQLIANFARIGEALLPIIENLMSLAMQLLPVIGEIVGSVINTIISLMPTIMGVITTISDILARVFEIVGQLVDLIVPFIVDIANQLGGLISDILPVIADLISNVVDAVMNVVNICLPIIQRIIEALMPIIKTLLNIVSTIISRLVPVIKSIVSIVSDIIKAVIDIITPIITVVMQIVDAIIAVLAPIVDIILQAIGVIIDVILGIVQVVMSVIEAIVAVISGIINVVMSIINMIVQFIMDGVAVIVGIVTTIIDTISGIISAIVGVVQGVWDGIVNAFSNAVSFFSDIFTSIFEVVSGVFNSIADFFTSVWDKIVGTFTTLGDTISGAIKGAINAVLAGAVKIINGFISAINFAIGVINAIPGVSISKLTELSVPALAKGGIVEKPTTALIGEAGKEVVMPLENNTGWISDLAYMISRQIQSATTPEASGTQLTPVNTQTSNTSSVVNGDTNNSYLTTNNNNTQQVAGDTDNSITFEPGAIQINVQQATQEEAMKMAQMIMVYIQRQQELKTMMNYG